MNFEKFSIGFPHIAHFPLDNEGRYFAMTKPLRIWDGETDKYTKFKSLREMWDYCFDGTHKVSDWFARVDNFAMEEKGGRGSGSGGGGQIKTFSFGGTGGGDIPDSVPRHFPVEANTRIKTKTEENAIKFFADKYRNANHEYGMLIDKQGFVHTYSEGTRGSVYIGSKKGTFAVHNHPGGGAFSGADLLNTARWNRTGIAAIGKDGDYYFRKTGHFKSAAFERAIKTEQLKGVDYDDAVKKWLTANQKKYGYTFEFKKKRK